MERSIAISAPLVGSAALYSSVVTTAPGDRTRIHHHGAVRDVDLHRVRDGATTRGARPALEHDDQAGAGDFVYIPAGEIHVEANASATEPLVVVLTRNCPGSHVVYLDGGADGAETPGAC